jgi:hypothetical protein
MAVAQHTEWERKQLESIELFLKQAIQAIDYFTETNTESLRETESDEDIDRSADWLKFRGIVLDLYSVLDYVWYLLYCHFSNGGEPDFSDKGCELGFPYKKRGIKCSTTPERDQTGKFVKEKLKMIWGDKIGEETHFWKEIGAVILNVQPKMIVGRSGAPETGKVVIQPGDEESFALLHYYRNCAAHKDLIRFMLRNSVIEIDQSTRVTRLVTSTERRDDCFYMELDRPGFWIQLPSSVSGSDREPSRLLVDVLTQLRKFVASIASQLLRSALLLPSAKNILEHHIEGIKLTTNVKVLQTQHEVTGTATMKNGIKIEKTATNESKIYAEEDACIKIMKSLPAEVVPNSPYSCLTSYYVSSLPQVQILERMPDGTCVKLLDDWKKKLEAGNMEVLLEYDKHFLVRSKPSGAVIFKLCSDMVDGPSADEARETAARKMIAEGFRLGLIEVKQLEWPPSLVQTLTKIGSKTYQSVLNEYKQKVKKFNMIVNLVYDDPLMVEHSCFETKLSLTVIQKDSSDEVFCISSSKQRGRAKNESKEAAAQEVVAECEKKKIIILNSHEE